MTRRQITLTCHTTQRAASIIGVVLALWSLLLTPAYGQSAAKYATDHLSESSAQNDPEVTLKAGAWAKRLEARLAAARAALTAYADGGGMIDAPAGVTLQDIRLRRGLLHRLVFAYEQQLRNMAKLEAARARREELTRQANAWSKFSEPPPFSILLSDRLREEFQVERLKINSNEAAVSKLVLIIEENSTQASRFEEHIRQFNEQLEGSEDGEGATSLSWQRDLARLRSEVAAATVAVLDLERQVRLEVVKESRAHLDLLQRQLIVADAGAKFTHADLLQVRDRIERQDETLQGEIAEVQTRRDAIRVSLASAQNELRRIEQQSDASPDAATRAAEAVSAREAQLAAAGTSIQVLRLLLECVDVERTAWEMRYAAYGSQKLEALSEAKSRLSASKNRLDLWRDRVQQELEVSSSQIELQEDRLNSLPSGSDLMPLLNERLSALRESDHMLLRFLRAITRLELLAQRWEDALQLALQELPLADRVRHLLSNASLFLQRLWTFELFTAKDTITVEGQTITGKRSITVGKVLMALFILVGGVWITGLISRVMKPIIVRQLKIEANQANLIQRWMRAAMIVCLVLFSMASVKIPLTVFAFAGGALAIGLGFGLQTLLKNFVSGLILLFERPFRVGDVIDVDGQQGKVTAIGLRASVLELPDGKETLIPNSSLLENNVTNWAYSSRIARFTVSVGVAYDADLRLVTQLLDETAERHGMVIKEPKPTVLLTEFDDSALTFELRFWVKGATQELAAQVSSDLRLMIAAAFSEHGIVIAFPQRDMHIEAAKPIKVEVMSPAGPAVDTRVPLVK
jgi:potassium-dependent mechanosensitive channel